MCTCKVCSKEFEPWMAEFECDDCDEYGLVERWYDWCIGEPDMITCPDCNGNKEMEQLEYSFCSEECREEYFYPDSSF